MVINIVGIDLYHFSSPDTELGNFKYGLGKLILNIESSVHIKK